MISDVLFDAQQKIERELTEHPKIYERIEPQIRQLLDDMQAMTALLDTSPSQTPH